MGRELFHAFMVVVYGTVKWMCVATMVTLVVHADDAVRRPLVDVLPAGMIVELVAFSVFAAVAEGLARLAWRGLERLWGGGRGDG